MRAVLRITAYLLSVGFLTACVDTLDAETAVPKSIIMEHVRAFNAGDVEAMAKMQHPDIQWLNNLIRRVWYYPAVDN